MKRTAIFLSIVLMLAVSCERLDTVGNYSIRSFGELLDGAPGLVYLVYRNSEKGGWSLEAPDGNARFFWSGNSAASPLFDVMIEMDAEPFIAAGLDVSKLPDNFYFNSENNFLAVGTRLGIEQYDGEDSPLALYERIVKFRRDMIGYHGAMDHYGINLGDGNLFEWAKDLNTNDKDIVFVLNPEPFIRAGVDPEKIEGWAFAKVPVEDEKGRMIEVDKILKPFDLQ